MKRIVSLLCMLASVALVAAGAFAEESRQDQARRYITLQQEIIQLFRAEKYDQALTKCQEMAQAFPDVPDAHYNLACALARVKKLDEAFAALSKAVEKGFADPAHLREDLDLESLRVDKRFEELALKARENETKGAYDQAVEVKGVKTVEGFPEGGLRYRVRMPETASKEKPARLIVWLHPSGGSMNVLVERMAPALAERGFALFVPTQKQWFGWTEEEGERLLNRTLPDVAKIDGIDVKRPLLMGFSAGGQMALVLWKENPDKFGGLVLDAAYPVSMVQDGEKVRSKMMDLPGGDVKKTPFFVIIGSKDQREQAKVVWQQTAAKWIPAGVPLSIEVVPDRGHDWLFSQTEVVRLQDWLKRVKAGELPSDPAPVAPAAAAPAPAAPVKTQPAAAQPVAPQPQ